MGDVSEILGIKKARKDNMPISALAGGSSSSKKRGGVKPPKPPNVSREVYALMGFNGVNGRESSGTPGAWFGLLPSSNIHDACCSALRSFRANF